MNCIVNFNLELPETKRREHNLIFKFRNLCNIIDLLGVFQIAKSSFWHLLIFEKKKISTVSLWDKTGCF